MRFIKLENGNVQLTDDSGNPVAAVISNAVQIREIGISAGIEILQNGYPIFQVMTSDVSQTQVLPAAGVLFTGNTYDLIQLLSNDFFFDVAGNGLTDGIVTIEQNSTVVTLLQNLVEEQKLTNKLLTKIYR